MNSKKLDKLLKLSFGSSLKEMWQFAAENSLCEDGCPAFGICPQNTKNKDTDQTIKYCKGQLKKWWKSE